VLQVIVGVYFLEVCVLIDDKYIMRKILPFRIEETWYALPLEVVETVVRSVSLVSLPEGAVGLLGLVDYKGTVYPVIDMRFRLHRPSCPVGVDQRIVLARRDAHMVAFLVDEVESVVSVADKELREAAQIYPDMDSYVSAILTCQGRKLQLCDPSSFLYFDHELLGQDGLLTQYNEQAD
jgi:purine-binding chemotaxis protein CheW